MPDPVVTSPTLRVDNLVVEFVHEGYAVRPLDGMSFEARAGELIVLLGPSGSGKTTLLSCLGGILTPTSGSIHLGELDITSMKGSELDYFRRSHVGFVFQAFNLIASLSAVENVAMPLILTGKGRKPAIARATALLQQVGLGDRLTHKPSKLSGGQQQRVAVARGLAADPQLLLADEPTANLDLIQAEAIIRLLRELRDQGRIIVVSTHDARLLPIADRIVRMVSAHEQVPRPAAEIELAAGTLLFAQGDPSDWVYIIVSGEIDILRQLAGGDEELIRTLGAGDYFGELGPMLGFPRAAGARARTAVRLRVLDIAEFRERVLHGI